MTLDPFELVRAEEMLLGYSATHWCAPYDVLAVEQEFEAPLLDPDTGEESKHFRLAGKIDCLLRDRRDGLVVLLESKTTSEDATDGSPYWLRTLMSSQLSTYLVGVQSLGYDAKKIVYDVLHRPAHRPLKATPVESRKYTKPTKAEPVPRLYDNQREVDETPEEFRMRIRHSILEAPSKYYNRGSPTMLARDVSEAAYDAWHIAERIRENQERQRYPRNPDACAGAGVSVCSFLPVCSGGADITDPFRYRRVENVHEELSPPKNPPYHPSISNKRIDLPLLTNSQMATERKCSRLHHFRYNLGVRSLQSTEAQRAGTLVHNGLEGWWTGKKHGQTEKVCLSMAFERMRLVRPVPAYLPEEMTG